MAIAGGVLKQRREERVGEAPTSPRRTGFHRVTSSLRAEPAEWVVGSFLISNGRQAHGADGPNPVESNISSKGGEADVLA